MKKHDYTAKNTMVEYMVSCNEYGQKFRTAGHWGGDEWKSGCKLAGDGYCSAYFGSFGTKT